MITFQQVILRLQEYWGTAGLRAPAALRHGSRRGHVAHGDVPARARPRAVARGVRAAVAPARRTAATARTRTACSSYHQYQVVLKPSPPDILDLYLGSLDGARLRPHEERRALRRGRLGEPDARRLGPRLGSVDERHGDHAVHLLPAGGRPRLQPDHRRDHLRPRAPVRCTCRTSRTCTTSSLRRERRMLVRRRVPQNEVEQSTYNFEQSNAPKLFEQFAFFESEAKRLLEAKLPLPGYEMILKAAHTFNLLDARGAISVTERAGLHRPHPQPVARWSRTATSSRARRSAFRCCRRNCAEGGGMSDARPARHASSSSPRSCRRRR